MAHHHKRSAQPIAGAGFRWDAALQPFYIQVVFEVARHIELVLGRSGAGVAPHLCLPDRVLATTGWYVREVGSKCRDQAVVGKAVLRGVNACGRSVDKAEVRCMDISNGSISMCKNGAALSAFPARVIYNILAYRATTPF